jgi:GT2 family glycosyltransferase
VGSEVIANAAQQALTTVVVPVWGKAAVAHLPAAIASLRSQQPQPRLLVVDNDSQVPLPPLEGARVIRSKVRLTLGSARDLGVTAATTPYVVVWDADDVMLPGTLARLQARIAADRDLVAVGCAILEQSEVGGRCSPHRWPHPWIRRLVRRPRLLALVISVWSVFPTTGATIMRTDAVRAGGGYGDADSGDDWCLEATLAWRGRFAWDPQPGRIYLQRPGSVWHEHRSLVHQRAHARRVRARLAHDAALPRAVRALLPEVALAQSVAIGGYLVVRGVRRIARIRHRPPDGGDARSARR